MFLNFIELAAFSKSWNKMGLDDEDLSRLQEDIMKKPEGDAQDGHLYKIRFASHEGKGKSGGARVAYVFVEPVNLVYLLFSFPKNKQANWTKEQKAKLKEMASILYKTAIKRGENNV